MQHPLVLNGTKQEKIKASQIAALIFRREYFSRLWKILGHSSEISCNYPTLQMSIADSTVLGKISFRLVTVILFPVKQYI